METNYEDSYYIMNTALYAAETYVLNTYNIITKSKIIHEYFGDVSASTLYPRFPLNNILATYTDDGYVLPSVLYYDSINKTFSKSEGPFIVDEGTLITEAATNLNVEYTAGYVYPTVPEDTSVIPEGNNVLDSPVSRPILSNINGSPLHSPLATTKTYLNVNIVGDAGSTIYVDGVPAVLLDAAGAPITESVTYGPVLNEDRRGQITLTLVNGINTFSIDATDAADNTSDPIVIIIDKQSSFLTTDFSIITKTLVTNDGNYELTLQTLPGSSVTFNGDPVLTYSTGLDTITNVETAEGIFDVSVIVTSPAGIVSKIEVTQIQYDSTLTTESVDSINSLGNTIQEIPKDIMMALFMIANHYYRSALYKHDETHSYGDNVSNRITFVSDRFPKAAHSILSKYIRY